jgi:hypothetical protein
MWKMALQKVLHGVTRYFAYVRGKEKKEQVKIEASNTPVLLNTIVHSYYGAELSEM